MSLVPVRLKPAHELRLDAWLEDLPVPETADANELKIF